MAKSPKTKSYALKSFFHELKQFFYDSDSHQLRKSPYLLLFMVSTMATVSTYGWILVHKFAKGIAITAQEFAVFGTMAGTVFVNFYSIIKHKKVDSDTATSLTSMQPMDSISIGKTPQPTPTSKSHSTPTPVSGTPVPPQIQKGDNR